MSQFVQSLQTLLGTPTAKEQLDPARKIRGCLADIEGSMGGLEDFDYNIILDHLAELLIIKELTATVAGLFRPLLIELVVRSTKLNGLSNANTVALCDMFSKLLPSNPQLRSIFVDLTQKTPSPLDLNLCQTSLQRDLTDRATKNSLVITLEILLRLLTFDPSVLKHWNMGPLFILMREDDEQIAPLAFRCFQLYSGLSERKSKLLVNETVYLASQMVV